MSIKLTVPDMACDACVQKITEAINGLDTQATVEADTTTKQILVATEASESSVKQVITAAGYSPV